MKTYNQYLIFGIVIIMFLLFTGYRDLSLGSFFHSGKWGPKGHNTHHK
ncbi:MAG: hypothetical protein IPL26_03065 [Leptospiraceae bacterium]|nr:hypothetical protein [Leptospiraceae bacterium]